MNEGRRDERAARAQQVAKRLEGPFELASGDAVRVGPEVIRFVTTAADESTVAAMWKERRNQDGKALSRFEWMALTERWCRRFGFEPPTNTSR